MMTDKYCPRGEIKNLEIELSNLKVKGTDVESYSQRFQELALMCSRMFLEESDEVEKYIDGLPDMIHESVIASKPKTMQDAIKFATELMDQKIRTLTECIAGTNPNSNVVMGMFLLKNRYALILFDTGADKSFISTAFSSLIDIIPTTLDHGFDINLADEIGSFDAIIGMDWLSKYHAVIFCDEKIVRIPFGNETLIVRGDGSSNEHGSRLNIISGIKTQKYLLKGCHVYLAHVTARKAEYKSDEKRLEDVPIIRDFPEVIPEVLQGIPPTQKVEFCHTL
nr:putative reverse transcriptase domain-containing protein [Tanacetum cinerariifolium]